MKLATVTYRGVEQACIIGSAGYVPIETVNSQENASWRTSIYELLKSEQLEGLTEWYIGGGRERLKSMSVIPPGEAKAAPLYRHPRKIWGIGMNYVKNAIELTDLPTDAEPVSFMKPDTSLIGPDDAIVLPVQSHQVTAEAELAIIIGKACKNIDKEEAPGVVAGFAASVDITAADIHAKNQRFLTRAKSFDTFFSLGSQLITKDEIADVQQLKVETWLNDKLHHHNVISNMRYHPWFIVAFHSQVMTLLPGDVILTGTPGAVVIRDGDVVECRISGFEPLRNPARL